MDPVDAALPQAFAPAERRNQFVDPTAYARAGANGESSIELAVRGAHCPNCMRKIETGLGKLPGVTYARLNLTSKKLTVNWTTGAVTPRRIAEVLGDLGFHAVPYDAGAEADHQRAEERFLLRCLAVGGAAAMNVMLFSISLWAGEGEMGAGTRGLLIWLSALIALPAVAYAGRPFFRSAWRALRVRQVNMDVPISLAVLLSTGLSLYEAMGGGGETYFEAAVTLVFLLLIGRYLDTRLRGQARSAAHRLAALQVAVASRIGADGHVTAVPAREIVPGDRILVGPGEQIPVNGVIEEGVSELDVSLITGESAPAEAGPGMKVYSGAVNQARPLVVRASAARGDSLLAEVTRLVEAGEQTRSRYVRLADRAAALYVPLVHTLSAGTLVGWLLLGSAGLHGALIHAIAVLIITCPCALGLAVPAVQIIATGRLFDAGVLVKSGDALERLAEADIVVFDKTGTLTAPDSLALDRTALDPAVLARAATLARASRHPLAQALSRAAGPGPVAEGVHEEQGMGLEAHIAGRRLRLGAGRWCGTEGDSEGAGAELWFAEEGAAPVRFSFSDRLRPDARETVEKLVARGLKPILLSGDRPAAVAAVAREVGIADWSAALTPAEKSSRLGALRNEGHRVLMVGDGLNDAPALAGAHVSIAPANAIDASQAACDFVLQGASLAPIVEALDVARLARRRAFENLGFSALYNMCAIPLAVAGYVTPLIAAIAMSSSSVLVTLNALRVARKWPVR